MSYVIVEYDKVQSDPTIRNKYLQVLQQLAAQIQHATQKQWSGLIYGGFTPGAQEYGRTTILPQYFRGFAAAQLTTFRQNFTGAPAWRDIFNNVMPEDIRIAWAGLAFTSKSVEFSELRWQIGDTLYPRINIEEIQGYNKPAIIFEEGFIIPEETTFLLRGYLEANSYQRVVPLGFSLYRRKDFLVTEAAITLP